MRHGRLLKLINAYGAVFDLAAKQFRQFQVRHEVKTARQIIAIDLPTFAPALQRYACELLITARRNGPATGQVTNARELSPEIKGLPPLGRFA